MVLTKNYCPLFWVLLKANIRGIVMRYYTNDPKGKSYHEIESVQNRYYNYNANGSKYANPTQV